MENKKMRELEERLKKMFELSSKDEEKPEKMKVQPNTTFVIRRRKGQADKRIVLGVPSS